MLLGIDFNNCVSVRRKAYDVDNPVQAQRSSGWKNVSYLPATPLGVELRRSSRVGGGIFTYPELRCACTGLSTFKTLRSYY